VNKITPQIPNDFTPVDKTYRIYGKLVKSNYPMPLPEVVGVNPDITITYEGLVPKSENRAPNSNGRVWVREDSHSLLKFYNSVGHMEEYRFSADGSDIRIRHSWPVWYDTLFALMNPVLAAASVLRGENLLHASSLVHNGSSTLIAGISGAGKSSLSAALAAGGMSLHSDDIACISFNDTTEPRVSAGYRRIKIDPGLVDYLPIPEDALLSIFSNDEVRRNLNFVPEYWVLADELSGFFHEAQAPLQSILILDERMKEAVKPQIHKLSKAAAAMALTEHVYGREWLNPPGRKSLQFCTYLAETVPVYKVHMPDSMKLLEKSAGAIFEQLIE